MYKRDTVIALSTTSPTILNLMLTVTQTTNYKSSSLTPSLTEVTLAPKLTPLLTLIVTRYRQLHRLQNWRQLLVVHTDNLIEAASKPLQLPMGIYFYAVPHPPPWHNTAFLQPPRVATPLTRSAVLAGRRQVTDRLTDATHHWNISHNSLQITHPKTKVRRDDF